jgi:transposase-like protein
MTDAPLRCPFCDSSDVELVSARGGQLITSQFVCRGCNTHFEALRDDFRATEEFPSTSS